MSSCTTSTSAAVTTMSESREAAPLLALSAVDAFYGRAQALDGVAFEMGVEALAVIGRNGMGKTTLCNVIMAIQPPAARGSIRFRGNELLGSQSYRIAKAGIGYVPQGRRLFPSLSTDEHLRMVKVRDTDGGGRRWTVDTVYELFPRLAQRKRISATQLSGGEQQMLAIGRALLTNPTLLVMDEPSEGLAPTVVEGVIATCKTLVEEGMAILLVEQNLGVATEVADRQLVMVAGRIAAETTAERLIGDPDAQRRYLGVEPLAETG
jgi:branched-chain amino acid transport system ATP-binding protein